MNGITINDKLYKFVETSKDVNCDQCDLKDVCGISVICETMYRLLHGTNGVGVFKELKVEK